MTPKQKQLKAKHSVFASQHIKAFKLFCQETGATLSFDNPELLGAFYSRKFKAKQINKELVADSKAARRIKRNLGTTVHRTRVEYNTRPFSLIDGSFLNVNEEVCNQA